jgi:hypothetical protein
MVYPGLSLWLAPFPQLGAVEELLDVDEAQAAPPALVTGEARVHELAQALAGWMEHLQHVVLVELRQVQDEGGAPGLLSRVVDPLAQLHPPSLVGLEGLSQEGEEGKSSSVAIGDLLV